MAPSQPHSSDEDPSVWLDRLVSASTADDVRDSLQGILDGFDNGKKDDAAAAVARTLLDEEPDAYKALLALLQTSEYKSMEVQDGSSLAARICIQLVERNNKNQQHGLLRRLLQEPTPGRLLRALMDVACHAAATDDEGSAAQPLHHTTFTRVMALQTIRQLASSSKLSHLVGKQLLDCPNGLHRLGSQLLLDLDEQVRNEALLLATVLTADQPAIAKNWMFQDVGSVVLQLAIREEGRDGGGALTYGPVLVQDCLQLLRNLIRHDAQLSDLVLESADILPALASFLDLRNGAEFRFPNTAKKNKKKSPLITSSSSKADEDDEDDLDALLTTGSSKRKEKKRDSQTQEQQQPSEVDLPCLLKSEEDVILTVLDILSILLEREDIKRQVWKRHVGLVRMIWDLAMLTPPPPGAPVPCAMPSPHLQQRALQVTALYLHDPDMMERCNGLDQLLYIVCTGGGHGGDKSLQDRFALSQSALHVIRRTLPAEKLQEMLMHSLAPPPPPADDEGSAEFHPPTSPQPTVVLKVLNTVVENLDDRAMANNRDQTKVLLLGATSALTIFLTDEASRSVFLRLAGNEFVERILLALEANSARERKKDSTDDTFVLITLLRFLAHWMDGAPVVTQAFLQSTQSSIVLSQLFISSNKITSGLTCLILGLVLLQVASDSTSATASGGPGGEDEKLYGGWTVSGIMEMVNSLGVSKYTSLLENLKKANDLPWSACQYEYQIFNTWCEESVFRVRKRIVQQLVRASSSASSDEANGEDGEHAESTPASSSELHSLQRLVAQQSEEMEELRDSLSKAQHKLETQGSSHIQSCQMLHSLDAHYSNRTMPIFLFLAL